MLENVWEGKTAELREEIIRFWMQTGALEDRERAVERVEQVMFIVRHPEGGIAGVSTVFRRLHRELDNTFYFFRCFVAEEHRQYNLGVVLLVAARDFLNERYVAGSDTSAIGMMVEVENERLRRIRNQAVWPLSGFVYIGKNPRGDHLRVYYFHGARIS